MNRNSPIFPLILLLFLTGFSFFKPTWQSINALIAGKYPDVPKITTDELSQILEKEQIYLIDVRAQGEFAVSQIKGAVHIEHIDDVDIATRIKIIAYCSVGYRSADFINRLQKKGYTNVFNLHGSIFEWANKGYPLFQGDQLTTFVHPFNTKWGGLLEKKYHSYKPAITQP